MGSHKFDDKFKEVLSLVVEAKRILDNVDVAENALPLAAQNFWIAQEKEKLEDVATSILKHLETA